MIGFWLTNLLIPGDPQEVLLPTPSGEWTIDKNDFFKKSYDAILNNQCASTYAIEHPASLDQGSEKCDSVLAEMTPILLGTSFLTGLAVTAKGSLPHSDVSGIVRQTDHWPRERALGVGYPVITNTTEFQKTLKEFVAAWPGAGQQEKAMLLVHHWLDALGCWSLEDLFLSASTLLQIIAATEERIQNRDLSFFQAVTSASHRKGIRPLSRDYKDMRNVLIHEGKLVGGSFTGTSHADCATVTADALNWFDDYMHSALNIGPVNLKRFSQQKLCQLNAYSIPN